MDIQLNIRFIRNLSKINSKSSQAWGKSRQKRISENMGKIGESCGYSEFIERPRLPEGKRQKYTFWSILF
jgi:hypothetical protein